MSATIIPFERPRNESVMSLRSLVPETAMTAELLGTERESNAIQISPDGLMLTVGYSIMEATEVWISNRKGQTAEGIILAHDYDSGGKFCNKFNIMGCQQDAVTTLCQAAKDLTQLLFGGVVQATSGFIKQEQWWLCGHNQTQGQQHLLAFGEISGVRRVAHFRCHEGKQRSGRTERASGINI